jgi:hypothetical protein
VFSAAGSGLMSKSLKSLNKPMKQEALFSKNLICEGSDATKLLTSDMKE